MTAPESNSGGDAYRHQAQMMPLDEWVPGDLNQDGGDQTDWKVMAVGDKGDLLVEFSADDPGAIVSVVVYDKYGYELGKTMRKENAGGPVSVGVKVTRPGKHFVKLRSEFGEPSAYSLRASLGGVKKKAKPSTEPTPDF